MNVRQDADDAAVEPVVGARADFHMDDWGVGLAADLGGRRRGVGVTWTRTVAGGRSPK
jgi:hypothetical protein